MTPTLRRGLAVAVALATLATAAHVVQGLAGSCWARASEGTAPECCRRAVDERLERRCDCCSSPWIASAAPASLSAPDESPTTALVALAPIALDARLRGTRTKGFRPRIERPPDRSPPTRTTVLLL